MSDMKDMPKLDRPPSYTTIDPRTASQDQTNTASIIRELEIHRRAETSTTGLYVKSNDNVLYYVGHYNVVDHPDIILYAGYDSHGPRLAQTDFLPHMKDFKIYVGDVKTPSNDDWDMIRASGGGMFRDTQHRFEIRYNTPDTQRVKRRFYWQKTNDSKLGASRLSPRNFKLVDEQTDAVAAVYLEKHMGVGEHKGTVRFNEDLPEYAQVAALMGLLGLLERLRRDMRGGPRAFP